MKACFHMALPTFVPSNGKATTNPLSIGMGIMDSPY